MGRCWVLHSLKTASGCRTTLGQTWRNVPGPWDTGGKVMALSITDQACFHVALLEGVNDILNLWQGKPGN